MGHPEAGGARPSRAARLPHPRAEPRSPTRVILPTGLPLPPDLLVVTGEPAPPGGPGAAEDLVAAVAKLLPGVRVGTCYLHRGTPLWREVMRERIHPAVVVPLLLVAGPEVIEDLAVGLGPEHPPLHVCHPLGPTVPVAQALAGRLTAVGARHGDAVVLVATGVPLPSRRDAVRTSAALLARHFGPAISTAFLDSSGTQVTDAVADWHARGYRRVYVAPYELLACPEVADITRLSRQARATAVSAPLGGHQRVIEHIVGGYAQGCQLLGRAGSGVHPASRSARRQPWRAS